MFDTFFAVIIGKSISLFTRFFKIGGGSAAPGFYALKIDPYLIQHLIQNIPHNIIVTGTNGKTTTTKMIEHFAKAANLRIIRNHTGSNLERGLASTLLTSVHPWGGNSNYDLGIWEVDEAAFNTVISKIKPDIIVFLNAFRDQLDRYGEVDSVVKKWQESLKSLDSETLVIINADDSHVSTLIDSFQGKILSFGIQDQKIIGEVLPQKSKKIKLDYQATNLKLDGLEGTKIKLNNLTIQLPIPGIYHVYDFLAAFAVATNLGIKDKTIIDSLQTFSPAFGRVEKFSFPHSKLNSYIFLIKNPVGATQVLETIAPNLKPNDTLLLALNDNFADGTDVSWIWDTEWERLQEAGYSGKIVVSGTRAADFAVRLKYADLNNLQVEANLSKAFDLAKQNLKGRVFFLPTYTAMLELQHILVKKGIKNHYWKEEN